MLEKFVSAILYAVESMGYFGLFAAATLESTFIPIGSEFTMIPAGYLVYQDKMEFLPAFFANVAGTVAGSLINYALAYRYGRSMFLGDKKFFGMGPEKLAAIESFFFRHGPISIFLGRLVFGARHYISFPAGLAKMDLKKFCLYTAAGGAIWVGTLMGVGYAAGGNEAWLKTNLPIIKGIILLGVGIAIFIYIRKQKQKTKI